MDKTIQNDTKRQVGFTLIELLIVIALLGFLSITGLSMFQGSQKRARDNRRKNDLGQIAKALEMYANDYDYGYPVSIVNTVETGKIVGCGETTTPATACNWGTAWVRGVTYMQKLPKDPGSGSYCYQKVSSGYKLFAKLESPDDADYNSDVNLICAGVKYSYVLLSSNITPTPKP
jgi:prepilin-type N-terminal cleavage/methylation domain-containing protein